MYDKLLEMIISLIRIATIARMSGDSAAAYHNYALRRVLRDIDKELDCDYISIGAIKIMPCK